MNERITENIVREHFRNDALFNEVEIEEQKSKNPIIDKLLKTASKGGTGKGYPEFIISYGNNPDFLIVVECKADIKFHESKNKKEYGRYAVDGVLLYASYLSREFDVLSIAASGQNREELKVSHYLFLRRQIGHQEILSNKLLSLQNYSDSYKNNPEKLNKNYYNLLIYSNKLNNKLHSLKVKEAQRSILISAILLGLDNEAFCKSYNRHNTPQELAEFLIATCMNQFKNAGLDSSKIENIKNTYSFIATHQNLSQETDVLAGLIKEFEEEIGSFQKSYEYYDFLSQFYIEFLRYANSDKGLGIVLTPPHIADFFVEIAEVDKNSAVLDNCAGTGGFLISAMRKMVKDAKGDSEKIQNIKSRQLVGVEFQDDIYALSCSNMYIHGDGKSNIIHGDCFDAKIIDTIRKKYSPNIAFLNPPYKAEKTDKEELEFVLNALEMLSINGTCVAILPMSCVISNNKWKGMLLSKHSLEGVFSMPAETFNNSKVSVSTAVIVVKAHIPHKKEKEVYFGYYREDGFEKQKPYGRIDRFGKWEGIKKSWVNSFKNKKEIIGLSVKKAISPSDEWCAEAYMETDYSALKEEDFIKTLKNYIVYQFLRD